MVNLVGNRHDDMSSNPGRGCLHFTLCKYPWERCVSNYSLSSYGQIVDHTGIFNLGTAVKEKENAEFKPVNLRLKIDKCQILFVWRDMILPLFLVAGLQGD